MVPPEHDIVGMRNAVLVIIVLLMVLAFTSTKLGISLAGALAFWGIVLALTSVVALLSVILFHDWYAPLARLFDTLSILYPLILPILLPPRQFLI